MIVLIGWFKVCLRVDSDVRLAIVGGLCALGLRALKRWKTVQRRAGLILIGGLLLYVASWVLNTRWRTHYR